MQGVVLAEAPLTPCSSSGSAKQPRRVKLTGLPFRFPNVPGDLSAAGSLRPIAPWSVALALALLAGTMAFVPTATMAAEAIALPFPGGQAVRIIQGYNGASHRGRSQYGLDLVLAAGSTSDVEVVSPIEGAVSWAQGPGAGNGCMAIAFGDSSYSITLCHVRFHRAYRPGESIARGQSLGTVGRAGSVGNNGMPHVHLELHRGGRSSSPVPFSRPDGLPLEGVALSASGAYNEHSRQEPIVSTNRPGGGAVLAASTLPGRPEQPARPATARQVAAVAPSTARTRAVVTGTEGCLNVREGPSTGAPIVGCLAEGTSVTIVDGPTRGGAFNWYRIERAQSADKGGWVVEQYLDERAQ